MRRPLRYALAWVLLSGIACGRSDLFSAKRCAPGQTNCTNSNGGNGGHGGDGGGGGFAGGGGFGGGGGFAGFGGGFGGFGGGGPGGFAGGAQGGTAGFGGRGGFAGGGFGGTAGGGGCVANAPEICNNGFDDNCNGLLDCLDPGCLGNRLCIVPGTEVCNNGIDDDDDRLVDCADPDCAGSPACIPNMGLEICGNGVDDNRDGLTDCADPQCVAFPACLTVSCQADVDFGTLAAHGADVSNIMNTVGAPQGYASCVPSGGRGRVGRFVLTGPADVRVDLTQAAGGAHAVSVFRAGAGQACDQNPVGCFDAGTAAASHTFPGLTAGTYWVVVESHPGTQGSTTVRLSTGSATVVEICNNGIDDDGNGLVDCQDLACQGTMICAQRQCVADILIGALVMDGPTHTVTFDTTGKANRYHPTCVGTSTAGDETISVTLPEAGGILLTYMQTGSHGFGLYPMPGPGLACDNAQRSCIFPDGQGGQISYSNLPAGRYLFIVKGRSQAQEGAVTLSLSAFINRRIELCGNGIDDDDNGLTDCADPACFGIAGCNMPACVPDVDLGALGINQFVTQTVDVTAGRDLYQTRCGRGNGKEQVLRFTTTEPMGLGISCTQTGSQVLQLAQQIGPLDACSANETTCADLDIIPFGCNFEMAGLQPGDYNMIVEAFQAGTEGVVDLTLYGIPPTTTETCNNGIDDDGDGATDCADLKCVTSPLCTAFACHPDDNIGILPLNGVPVLVNERTTSAGDNQQVMCTTGTGGQDAVVDFELPGTADVTFEWGQVGSHALAVFANDGTLFACDAGAAIACIPTGGQRTGQQTVARIPAGRYHLVIDADAAGSEGAVLLQISGVNSP
jgi:hypothetical protein